MHVKKARELIKKHEGYRSLPYKCTADKLTIGYGRNLEDNGIRLEEALFMLQNDIRDVIHELEVRDYKTHYSYLSENRKAALIDLCYNLGINRLLGFKKMFAALGFGDYKQAAAELLDSRYARQVGQRAVELAKIIETDEIK